MKVELVYDSDCPNVKMTRSALREALVQAGMELSWREWNRADTSAPAYVRRFGSPTILLDGRDVCGFDPGRQQGDSCRLYHRSDGSMAGVPPVSAIVAALTGEQDSMRARDISNNSRTDDDRCSCSNSGASGVRRPAWPRHVLTFMAGFLVRPCCSVPAALALVGLGASGVAAALQPYRWLFLGAASVFFTISFYWNFIRNRSRPGMIVWGFSVLIAAFFLLGPVWPTPKLDDNASGRGDPVPIEEFKTVRLRVEGMVCEACVNRLQRALMRMEGVHEASVDLEKKLAEVRYDTGKTDPGKIRERIADAGFSSASANASSTENEEDEEKMP